MKTSNANEIIPDRLYNISYVCECWGIERDTLVDHYVKPEKIRCRKIGRNYFFIGRWLIEDFENFETGEKPG